MASVVLKFAKCVDELVILYINRVLIDSKFRVDEAENLVKIVSEIKSCVDAGTTWLDKPENYQRLAQSLPPRKPMEPYIGCLVKNSRYTVSLCKKPCESSPDRECFRVFRPKVGRDRYYLRTQISKGSRLASEYPEFASYPSALLHRLVFAMARRRYVPIPKGQECHHINLNSYDPRDQNLVFVPVGVHQKAFHGLELFAPEHTQDEKNAAESSQEDFNLYLHVLYKRDKYLKNDRLIANEGYFLGMGDKPNSAKSKSKIMSIVQSAGGVSVQSKLIIERALAQNIGKRTAQSRLRSLIADGLLVSTKRGEYTLSGKAFGEKPERGRQAVADVLIELLNAFRDSIWA